jgi:hypothetical protein
LVAIWIAWTSQSKAHFKSSRRDSTPWDPGIFSNRYG